MIMKRLLLVCMLLAGCHSQSSACDPQDFNCEEMIQGKQWDEIEWQGWQVDELYNYGNQRLAEKIIAKNNGFSSFEYFPTSLVILIHNAINRNDSESYERAMNAAEALYKKYEDGEFKEYLETIQYLKTNGEHTNFINGTEEHCALISGNYAQIYESSFTRNMKQNHEFSVWYGLYANNGCSTPKNRARYVAALIELNADKARSEYNRILDIASHEPEGDTEFKKALCALRQKIEDDTGGAGITKLEKSDLVVCPE